MCVTSLSLRLCVRFFLSPLPLYIFYILYTVKLPPNFGLGAGRAKTLAERQVSLCRSPEQSAVQRMERGGLPVPFPRRDAV